VGQYSEKYFSRRTGQAENLEKPVHRTFGKALALFQMSYGLNNGVFSIIMDPQSEATIHLKEAVFLSKEWGTPYLAMHIDEWLSVGWREPQTYKALSSEKTSGLSGLVIEYIDSISTPAEHNESRIFH
jgi:hypothetical protein